jgi:hypothetical protein
VVFFALMASSQPAAASGSAPVAEAGLGLLAYVGDTVELNGSGSVDPEGDPLTYAWEQTGGPPVDLQGADSSTPRFEVETPGTLRFSLVVNDGTTSSPPDEVEVVVPYKDIGDDVATGCAVVPPGKAASAAAVAALLCLVRRRR